MSFIDVIVSSAWFFTNLFVPSSIDGEVINYPLALGNDASCHAQGFIVQFSISSILYNASLSYYYLLVKYNYKPRQLQKVEKWIHIIPITYGFVTATVALCLDSYNFAVWDCWIAPGPNDSPKKRSFDRMLQWAFYFGPLWCAVLFAAFNMIQVFENVRNKEKEASEWIMKKNGEAITHNEETTNGSGSAFRFSGSRSLHNNENNDNSSDEDNPNDTPPSLPLRNGSLMGSNGHSVLSNRDEDDIDKSYQRVSVSSSTGSVTMKCTKRVAKQGLMYVGAFVLTFMFPTVSRIIEISGNTIPPFLIVLSGTFIPSQGFFNGLVYFRLRFIRCGKKFPNKSKFWIAKRIIRLTLCPCTENAAARYNRYDGNDVEPLSHSRDVRNFASRGRSSVSHSYDSPPNSGDKATTSKDGRSHISNQSVGASYPSYPSNLSSDMSCFVSETEQDKSGTDLQSAEDTDPTLDAENIARVVSPASLNPLHYYQKAREMVKDGPVEGSNMPQRTYRDVFQNKRKKMKVNEVVPEESDEASASIGFDRLSDFLSTIDEESRDTSKH